MKRNDLLIGKLEEALQSATGKSEAKIKEALALLREEEEGGNWVVNADDFSGAEAMLFNAEQLKWLFSKTPKKHIKQRKAKGGGTWDYVSGVYMKKMLNYLFGWDWDFEVVEHKIVLECKQVIVLGKLRVRVGENELVKMQWGRADVKMWSGTNNPLDLGNDLKAATTDALKKCASELGVASDVYGKNEFREIKMRAVEVEVDGVNDDALLKALPALLVMCDNLDELQVLYSSEARYAKSKEMGDLFEERRSELMLIDLEAKEEGGDDVS